MALLVSHVDMDGGNKEVPVASRWHEMETVITEAERAGCDVGIAVIGPHGMRFEHRGEDLFHSASCIKIAIMIELFRMVDRGETSLEDVCILRAEDKVPGSGVLQYLHDGIELTFGDIAYLMMAISDNPATNILIDHVGMDNVNTMMRDLGMEQSLLGRRMLGRMALEGEQENVATPNEFALMLRAILNRTAATASSCDKMIVFLEKQQNDRRIGRYVPDGIRWGSKTGSYSTVANDVGFVETEEGPVVISAFTKHLPDLVTGEQILGDMARAAMSATGVMEPLRTS